LENENSNRRSFIRRLARLGAAGGVATLLLGQLQEKKTLIPEVQAQTPLYIDQSNTGSLTTSLTSSYGGYAFSVRSTPTSGIAVDGYASATSGATIGVNGESLSYTGGIGVKGLASGGGGTNFGVYGESYSTSGTGVQGYAAAAGGVGVRGKAGNVGAIPMVARGANGQTANLQEWQNYTGTALSVVDKIGRLGVGTSTPGFPLNFPNTLGDKISLWGNSGAHYGFGIQPALLQIHTSSASSDIAFGYGRSGAFTEKVRFKGNGNVGIGTKSPTERLHVIGKVRASQGFVTGDITFANGYKLTEDKKSGLLFMNRTGEQIAKLDEQGNLHIKGKIIQDL